MCTCAFSSKLPAYEIRGMCNHMFHSSNVFEQSVFEQSASVIFCHSVNRIFEGYTHYVFHHHDTMVVVCAHDTNWRLDGLVDISYTAGVVRQNDARSDVAARFLTP